MKKRFFKGLIWTSIGLFILANIIVYNHAYCFTHFSKTKTERPKRPEEYSLKEKAVALFSGVQPPKPQNSIEPNRRFSTVELQSHKKIEAWDIPNEDKKGVVILFHGYISCKANVLPYSNAFQEMGYSTILVDFMGHGNSEGNETSIGWKEGRDVKAAFEYAQKTYPDQEIILHGSSMGAVAIMKSIEAYDIKPDKIILECPFGSMLETAKGRFEIMGLPTTPFAQWLILFGGWQMGFNAFDHNPTEYATKINIPTLLMNGAQDARVSRKEINEIFENLKGEKTLLILENSAHQIYLNNDAEAWKQAVLSFFDS